MNILRRLGGILLALALTAVAAPALAQKSYTLTASPLTGTSPQTITLTFTAVGNSSFNSLTVAVPSGYTVPIANVSASRGTVSQVTGGFAVSGITTPVGSPSQVVTVTMAGVTTTGTCGTGLSGTWTAQPWTGSSPGSGQKFNLSGTAPTTSIAPPCYTVTPSVSGTGGTISPASPQTVAINGTPSFTLTPSISHNIGTVTGTCGGSLSSNTFTTAPVTANCSVIANFSIKTYTLTYSATTGGSVSPSPQTVNHGSSGSPVTATRNANYRFVNWSDGSTANPRTDSIVTGDIAVTANFAQNRLTVTSVPAVVGAGASFPVTIGIDGPGGQVSVSVSGTGCTLTEPNPATFYVTGTSHTFNVTIAPLTPPRDQTSCVLNVAAPGYEGATYAFANVFGGVLGCIDDTSGGGLKTFDGSIGAASEAQSGFFQGNRYKKNDACPLAFFKTANTIDGSNVTVDGYQLPPNFAYIGYVVEGGSILLGHTITFAPRWSNEFGQFDPARIRYCKKTGPSTDCSNPANQAVARGCTAPAIAMTSIPFVNGVQEPGCVRSWVVEIVDPVAPVLPATVATCGGIPRPTPNHACMLLSIEVTEGIDPPWGMTDE